MEVKEYIQELIVNGSLSLCIDYRLLNNKTVPDCHPLPRIQDPTDSLGVYG